MSFPDPKQPQQSPISFPKLPQFNLQQAFTNIQNHCSAFLHENKFPNIPLFKTHVESSLSNLQSQAKTAVESTFSNLRFQNPAGFARIAPTESNGTKPMTPKAIEERLGSVPVYALSNSSDEFVLVAGENTGKSLGLFCFREKDAQLLLQQMKAMEPSMGEGSKVVPVSLSKVFELKVDGVAFRLIPEPTQIKHALEERKKAGNSDYGFSGIPVFQSRSLVLRTPTKGYRPVFFRKEDLDDTLAKAASDQNRMNPAVKGGDIQVAVLEDIVREMKFGSSKSSSDWNDVVFIPPGLEFSTNPSKLNAKSM